MDPELALINKSNFVVKIFNLSFKTRREELTKFATSFGVKFLHTAILMDASHKSTGMALACVASDEDVRLSLQLMNQQTFQGRPLRISRFSTKTERKGFSSSSSRYYVGANISIKCLNCGLVGHRQKDCTEKPQPLPCHLCAGIDHEAGK